jgi:hypothetical protein
MKDTDNKPKKQPEVNPEENSIDDHESAPDNEEKESELVDNPETDQAVEEVTRTEGDKLLQDQDEGIEVVAPAKGHGIWGGIKSWWHNKLARDLTITAILLAAAGLFIYPATRYWILNTCGVRASASVIITDEKTRLPLKGVKVEIGDVESKTDADGKVVIAGLKLGSQYLEINQTGFAAVEKPLIIGWGSNPLAAIELQPTGIRFTIILQDYLSEKSVAGAVATSGQATATSDKNGKIELTFASLDDAGQQVKISKDAYRSELITLADDPKQPTLVKLVTSNPAVYVSKQSGRYDVYRSYIDGKDPKVIFAGTGSETSNISLVVSPDNRFAALVSTRDNQHDGDGFLLSSLTLINVEDGSSTTLGRGAQIQLIDWIGSRLIYELVSADPAAGSSKYIIVGYDAVANTRVQLVAAEHLNAVFSAQGTILFAVADDDSSNANTGSFYRISPDGANKQKVLDKEVWSGQRVDYNTIDLQTTEGWSAYDILGNRATDISSPSSLTNRLYSDKPDGSQSAWVNNSDGQSQLNIYNIQTAKDQSIQTTGVAYPVRWITSDAVVFRLVAGNEIADYAISTQGRQAYKIADVANSYGFSAGQ